MPYKAMIDNLKDNQTLSLRNSNIVDSDVKSLAQALKGTKILKLDLSNNNIGCNGLKYLTQVLKDTQIESLNLDNNNIMVEGIKYLTESLKDNQIVHLYLSKNKIGTDAADYLNKILSNTKIQSLSFDYFCTENSDVNQYIDIRSYFDKEMHITLHDNKIGIDGAKFINTTFKNIGIATLRLVENLEADNVEYLAQAFKNINISKLKLSENHFMNLNGIQYLVQIFKGSKIYTLESCYNKLYSTGAKLLAEFLREVTVLDLVLDVNRIQDKGMKYLVPVLKNSDIMHIGLSWSELGPEGAKYLSEILKNSKILTINLCNNSIGPDGARYLAESLPYSQVTSIHLHGNGIEYAGYQYLIDVVDSTNLSWVNLNNNNIEEGLEGQELWPYSIPRNNYSTIKDKICHAFKELVTLNSSNEFEFIVPRTHTADIDQYVFLIRTLINNPNSNVHIINMMCVKDHSKIFDFNLMDKINDFIAIMPEKFITFIDDKLPDLIKSSGSYNFVNLVKQFEDMQLYHVVQHLLLHRVLYYVDENQEILHPFIYKMLNKYRMPIIEEQLEPNKKEVIIAYYQNHQEIEGVQEIIDLLGSESFK